MGARSIRTQVALVALLPATLLAVVLAAFFTFFRLEDAEHTLAQLGEGAARHLASAAEFPLVTGNQDLLRNILNDVAGEPHIAFAQIRDGREMLLASYGNAPADLDVTLVSGGGRLGHEQVLLYTAPVWQTPVEVDDYYHAEAAHAERKRIGWVAVGVSTQDLSATRNQLLLGGLAVTLLGLLVTYAIALALGARLSTPLHALAGMIAELGKGHLGARIRADGQGELLQLQTGVNDMASAMQQAQQDLQQRIREATADLSRQKEAAERANADKSRFLAATSHDLRQPMHALGLFAAALKEKVDAPEQIDLVRKIEDSVAALEGMFNVLLDVSKLEAGVLTAQPQAFLLQPLLTRLGREWGGRADEKGIRFRVRATDLAVQSDPIFLGRILNNLVKNAIRYTARGGVLVACRRRGDDVVIQVWDTGIGIAPEHIDHIFQEFYQVDNPERNRSQGLGLGLFIVHRLGQLLGHPVQVRSRPGQGSVFSVALPRVATHTAHGPVYGDMTRFGREWILLIEDDEQVRTAMRFLLEGWGLRVQAAAGLEDSMTNLPDLGRPALILSDYRLRDGASGIEVIAHLRKYYGRDIPAVLISGDTSAEGIAGMQQSGLPVLHKPVRPAKLRALLNHLLSGENASERARALAD